MPKPWRPSPVTMGQGLVTWLLFLALGRIFKPFQWIFGQIRRAMFNWSGYGRYLREQSVIEGVFNGSKLWLLIGGGVWGVRAIRRASGRTERVVLREVLEPGERIIISQIPRKVPRKQRRAAARAS